jgi:hypothetical protein
MPVAYSDIFLAQATKFNKTITLKDDNGNAVNLSGYSVLSYAKRSYYTNRVALVFNASISDASNGIITLSANSSITANIGPGKLVYDVIISNASTGDADRVMEGTVFVSPSTSKGPVYSDYYYSYDTTQDCNTGCNPCGNNNTNNIYTNNIYAANIIFANTDMFNADVDGGIYQ